MSSPKEVAAEAFSLLNSTLENPEARAEELTRELWRKRPTKNNLEKQLDVIKHRREKSEQDRDLWKTEAGQLEESIDNANAKLEQLKAKLEIAESGPEKLTKQEINYWRAQARSLDKTTTEYTARIRSLRQDVKARDEELSELRSTALADEANTPAADSQADALGAALSQRDQAQERLAQISTTVATVNKRLAARDTELQELNAQRTLLESEIGRLKEALREERECAENFGEIANERLDQLNKSRELHEEMEERYEEAKWHLGKAGYFERLVKRRKSLISSLLAAIRAK